MVPKYQQNHVQGQPLAPSTTFQRSDEESRVVNSHLQQSSGEERITKKKKKIMKYLACISIIAIVTLIILVFALVFLRAKTPKVRLDDVTITNNNGSANAVFTARVSVRNRNFGRYKFDSSVATIRSRDNNNSSILGRFAIEDERVRARSTKRIYVVANLDGFSSSGNINLSVEARLRGKVELIRVFKRRKNAEMNCVMSVNLMAGNSIQNLNCE